MNIFGDKEGFLGFWGEAVMQASGARLFLEGIREDPEDPGEDEEGQTANNRSTDGSGNTPDHVGKVQEGELC